MKKENQFCEKPDIDVPGLVCGHPLPCPHHTIIAKFKKDNQPYNVKVPDNVELSGSDVKRLDAILSAIKNKGKKT